MNTVELNVIKEMPIDEIYVLVKWHEIQDLKQYTWFKDECLLQHSYDNQDYLEGNFFIPIKRMVEYQAGDLSNRMAEPEG